MRLLIKLVVISLNAYRDQQRLAQSCKKMAMISVQRLWCFLFDNWIYQFVTAGLTKMLSNGKNTTMKGAIGSR